MEGGGKDHKISYIYPVYLNLVSCNLYCESQMAVGLLWYFMFQHLSLLEKGESHHDIVTLKVTFWSFSTAVQVINQEPFPPLSPLQLHVICCCVDHLGQVGLETLVGMLLYLLLGSTCCWMGVLHPVSAEVGNGVPGAMW